MSATIRLSCDGCFETAETERFKRDFASFSGRSYGFGRFIETTPEDLVKPTGWVLMDPYTGCTYCPKCWAEIMDGSAA